MTKLVNDVSQKGVGGGGEREKNDEKRLYLVSLSHSTPSTTSSLFLFDIQETLPTGGERRRSKIPTKKEAVEKMAAEGKICKFSCGLFKN
jgi:hypothetical protein